MWSISLYAIGALSGLVFIYYVFLNLVLASEESSLLDQQDD
ncbi:hypothetical protein [Shewanella sedimentimangrovi]|nr:hypothetical protein [Shewanella sedimentimangrovi]